MTMLKIEWAGRRHASDADEARGFEAAEAVLAAGGDWDSAQLAFHAAMTSGWENPEIDNYTLTTKELFGAANLMDDELREDIHDDERARDPIWFMAEYRRRHADKFGAEFAL